MQYAPGVTINAARGGGSGVDTFVVDPDNDTSLGAGAAWTNASGDLTVRVTSLGAAGATVTVDFAIPPDFAAVGTPVIGGDVSVGGRVTLDTGGWSPTPTTTTIRWTANGSPVAGTDNVSSFTPTAALAGKTLVAEVTAARDGYTTRSARSAGVTVSAGSISVTTRPSVTGSARVGRTLRAEPGTWTSGVAFAYAWFADGTRIRHASARRLLLTRTLRGERLTVRVTGSKPGCTSRTATSRRTPRIT